VQEAQEDDAYRQYMDAKRLYRSLKTNADAGKGVEVAKSLENLAAAKARYEMLIKGIAKKDLPSTVPWTLSGPVSASIHRDVSLFSSSSEELIYIFGDMHFSWDHSCMAVENSNRNTNHLDNQRRCDALANCRFFTSFLRDAASLAAASGEQVKFYMEDWKPTFAALMNRAKSLEPNNGLPEAMQPNDMLTLLRAEFTTKNVPGLQYIYADPRPNTYMGGTFHSLIGEVLKLRKLLTSKVYESALVRENDGVEANTILFTEPFKKRLQLILPKIFHIARELKGLLIPVLSSAEQTERELKAREQRRNEIEMARSERLGQKSNSKVIYVQSTNDTKLEKEEAKLRETHATNVAKLRVLHEKLKKYSLEERQRAEQTLQAMSYSQISNMRIKSSYHGIIDNDADEKEDGRDLMLLIQHVWDMEDLASDKTLESDIENLYYSLEEQDIDYGHDYGNAYGDDHSVTDDENSELYEIDGPLPEFREQVQEVDPQQLYEMFLNIYNQEIRQKIPGADEHFKSLGKKHQSIIERIVMESCEEVIEHNVVSKFVNCIVRIVEALQDNIERIKMIGEDALSLSELDMIAFPLISSRHESLDEHPDDVRTLVAMKNGFNRMIMDFYLLTELFHNSGKGRSMVYVGDAHANVYRRALAYAGYNTTFDHKVLEKRRVAPHGHKPYTMQNFNNLSEKDDMIAANRCIPIPYPYEKFSSFDV
jgi:hypothetical protein